MTVIGHRKPRGLSFGTFAMLLLVSGCGSTKKESVDPLLAAQEAHRTQFGSFDLPRRVGVIENIGLQLPEVSPDGQRVLYLRTDQEGIPLLTLLGSNDEVSKEGLLSIWVRPVRGSDFGRRISKGRWCHSAVWSRSGALVAYVCHENAGTSIVVTEVATGAEERFGLPGHINTLPRFGTDERTVLYCSAESVPGPSRIYRQTAGQSPIVVSPEGQDCVLPVCQLSDGSVVCGQLDSGQMHWIRASPDHSAQMVGSIGSGERPGFLQAEAGIIEPVSPDQNSILYYDGGQGRIAVCDLRHGYVRRHRPGSVAACWMTSGVIALATPERVCCVNAENATNLDLMSGAWIPARYVRDDRRLILFGREGTSSRLSIYEIRFRTASTTAPAGGR